MYKNNKSTALRCEGVYSVRVWWSFYSVRGEDGLGKRTNLFCTVQYILRSIVLNKFHEVRIINITFRMLIRNNVPTRTIFALIQDIIKIHVLTKFHDDLTINLKYINRTNLLANHIKKNARPSDGNVFQATRAVFELIQHIIKTNFLTKFHDYQKYMWPLEF
ncbi:hypothetical protein DPMN_073094 [Dreissena polymorpha]|uniref:Uncharacterized protein n=1 Tax=Dreissena polymorpha TaxID=45954 RepID=A0A9D4BYI6_DREPO|nr:hypothetical protein DPMN_073094 [Dreissena polymorpha]